MAINEQTLISVKNRRTGHSLGNAIEPALSLRARVVGLLGRDRLKPSEGLWIEPCSSIHMFFMHFSLDAVFVDRTGHVTRTFPDLRPWRLARGGWASRGVLELPVGTITGSDTRPGDLLSFDPR